MEVYIKERPYEYVSDYKNGWQWSAGDDFKFPVTIGKYPCFIKRFERKRPENITGWGLLKNLKATFEPGLPRIHDIVSTNEKGKEIYYLFYECLEGDTLDNIIRADGKIDIEKLAEDLFRGLASIHRHGYWFSDFCEKNIFCREGGRYFLVDLDSAQPASATPDIDMYGDRQYLALASTFLVHQAGCKNFEPSDISGILLNYIQCMLLVLRIKLGLIDKKEDYRSATLANQLPSMLDELAPECRSLFKRLLERENQAPDAQEIEKLKTILLQQVIRGEKPPIKTPADKTPTDEKPPRHLDRHARETITDPPKRRWPKWALPLVILAALIAALFAVFIPRHVTITPPPPAVVTLPVIAAPLPVAPTPVIVTPPASVPPAVITPTPVTNPDSPRRMRARRLPLPAQQVAPPQPAPQPPPPIPHTDIQKILLDSLTISNVEYHHGLLGLGHRRRLLLENRSGYFLEKVLVEIVNPALGRNEIMTLSQIKPHAKVILLDNLPGDDKKIKGVARSVHLPSAD